MDPSISVALIALAGTIATVAGGVTVAVVTAGRGTKTAAQSASDKTIQETVASAILAEKVNELLDDNARLRADNEDLLIENAMLKKARS